MKFSLLILFCLLLTNSIFSSKINFKGLNKGSPTYSENYYLISSNISNNNHINEKNNNNERKYSANNNNDISSNSNVKEIKENKLETQNNVDSNREYYIIKNKNTSNNNDQVNSWKSSNNIIQENSNSINNAINNKDDEKLKSFYFKLNSNSKTNASNSVDQIKINSNPNIIENKVIKDTFYTSFLDNYNKINKEFDDFITKSKTLSDKLDKYTTSKYISLNDIQKNELEVKEHLLNNKNTNSTDLISSHVNNELENSTNSTLSLVSENVRMNKNSEKIMLLDKTTDTKIIENNINSKTNLRNTKNNKNNEVNNNSIQVTKGNALNEEDKHKSTQPSIPLKSNLELNELQSKSDNNINKNLNKLNINNNKSQEARNNDLNITTYTKNTETPKEKLNQQVAPKIVSLESSYSATNKIQINEEVSSSAKNSNNGNNSNNIKTGDLISIKQAKEELNELNSLSRNVIDSISKIKLYNKVFIENFDDFEDVFTEKNLETVKKKYESSLLFYNSLSLIMLAMLAGGLVGIIFILYFSFHNNQEIKC